MHNHRVARYKLSTLSTDDPDEILRWSAREALQARGVDAVAVVAVNDIFVLDAWLDASEAKGKVDGLADGSATFAKETGTDLDLGAAGLGVRSKRYAALIDDGVVRWIDIEDNSSCATVSSAEVALGKL